MRTLRLWASFYPLCRRTKTLQNNTELNLLCDCNAAAAGDYKLTDIVIEPPVHNKRGFVGKGTICPKKEVAVGFRMKIQKEVGKSPLDM